MPVNFLQTFETGHTYETFLDRFATPEQRRRWNDFHATVRLSDAQQALLHGFVREMKVFVIAGAWCGDCVNQCPIFDHFARVTETIKVRYFDRDASSQLSSEFPTCGGARVPTVLFVSEDGHLCGRYGDRTLAKYREVVATLAGAACPTGLVPEQSLTERVVQDWLNEFERIQYMLRTSSRLRQLHGD
jgi:hypothetical protein